MPAAERLSEFVGVLSDANFDITFCCLVGYGDCRTVGLSEP